jgi:hypothetical protein
MAGDLQSQHDRYAPFWAAALFILCLTGVSTTWIDLGDFWKGYVLDICGPAWTYILFRGLFSSYSENRWTRFFTSWRTFFILCGVSFSIEGMQYLEWYPSTFDPWDLLAYVSILFPAFIIDRYLQIRYSRK